MSVGDIRSVHQGCLNSCFLSAITQTLPYTGRILRFGVFLFISLRDKVRQDVLQSMEEHERRKK